MKLIGLNGRLHSGKDTAVDFIRQAATPANVERHGFADKLKMSAALALGYDPTSVDEAIAICNRIKEGDSEVCTIIDVDHTAKIISGREFLQRYGTEAHRNVFGEEFWIDALLPKLDSNPNLALRQHFPYADIVVVSDVRLRNEAWRIRSLGGQVWRIDADKRLGPLPSDAHITEQPLPDRLVNITVPNNDSLDQFAYAVESAWRLTR